MGGLILKGGLILRGGFILRGGLIYIQGWAYSTSGVDLYSGWAYTQGRAHIQGWAHTQGWAYTQGWVHNTPGVRLSLWYSSKDEDVIILVHVVFPNNYEWNVIITDGMRSISTWHEWDKLPIFF